MARRPSEVPKSIVAQLNRGERASANLAEGLSIDMGTLAGHTLPEKAAAAVKQAIKGEKSYTKRMKLAGGAIHGELGLTEALKTTRGQTSSMVRSWGAYAVGAEDGIGLARRLELIREHADDPHFGVREWAWLALRDHIIDDLDRALTLLEPWVHEDSPYIRRYATELTRPRGVWCRHIETLKREPERGLPLLEPLKADEHKYVQDSVANWLNDAGKTRVDWVTAVVDRWERLSEHPATKRIARRSRRSIK